MVQRGREYEDTIGGTAEVPGFDPKTGRAGKDCYDRVDQPGVSGLYQLFSNVWVALILAAAAAVLAARNIGARRALEGALDGIEDREDFFCQLMEGNTMEFPGYPVVVTREYLVTAYQTVLVYRLEEVKKAGREELKKILFPGKVKVNEEILNKVSAYIG